MTNVFTMVLISSLFTGMVMLVMCASDKKLGARISPKKRTLAATLTLFLQPVMLAVATALSLASDIFGKVEETATEAVTTVTDTGVIDSFVAPVTTTTTTAVQDSSAVGVTTGIALPDFDMVMKILTCLWLAGVAVTALYKIVSYLRFVRNLKKSLTPCDCGTQIPAFTSPQAGTPFLMGFFRAKIILPEKQMDEEELRLAVRHEMIHHGRHDIQKKFFAEMLKCLNWFNPAFYVFASKLSELSELAVDEILSSELDYTGRKTYGGLLLKFASAKEEPVLCTDLSKGAKSLAERLELIVSDEKPKPTKGEKIALGVLTAATLAVIGISVSLCMTAVPTVVTGLEIDSGDSDNVIKIDLSNEHFVEAPTTIEDGPENPLLDADYTGCSVYVERWIYGFFDEPVLLDDDSAENIISIIESMDLDRLPIEINTDELAAGESTASLYTIVLVDGTEHSVGEIWTYYNISYTERVDCSCLIIDGYFYLMSDEGSELLSEFRQSWLEQYKYDLAVNTICRNEYKYNIVHSIFEYQYEETKQEMIDSGVIESEEEYYEILAGIDDVTKYVVPGT